MKVHLEKEGLIIDGREVYAFNLFSDVDELAYDFNDMLGRFSDVIPERYKTLRQMQKERYNVKNTVSKAT